MVEVKTIILSKKDLIYLVYVLEVNSLSSIKIWEHCANWTFINKFSSYNATKEAFETKMKMEDPWIAMKKYGSAADESFSKVWMYKRSLYFRFLQTPK